MSLPRLYAIVDADAAAAAGWVPAVLAGVFLGAGARLLQVRAKRMAPAAVLALAREIVTLARPAGARVIVNDRADLARLAGADGVHVGQDDLPPAAVRRLVGSSALVGRSTHDARQIRSACAEPIDYLAVGPVFGTRTKAGSGQAVGLELVRQARAMAGIRPVVAIGGITLDRAPAVLDAGATSVAVIGDLLAGDPAARVRAYLDAL